MWQTAPRTSSGQLGALICCFSAAVSLQVMRWLSGLFQKLRIRVAEGMTKSGECLREEIPRAGVRRRSEGAPSCEGRIVTFECIDVERHRSCAPPDLKIAPANSATHVCMPWTTAAGAAPKQPPPTSRYGALHTASALWCRVNHGFGVSVGVRMLKSTEIRQECMSAGRRPAAGK